MVSLETPVCEFDKEAVDFSLPGVDGKNWSLADCAGEKGLLVMFICNHCPYVLHINDEIVRIAREYQPKGVSFIAISSNDVENYPQDSPEKMRDFANDTGFVRLHARPADAPTTGVLLLPCLQPVALHLLPWRGLLLLRLLGAGWWALLWCWRRL